MKNVAIQKGTTWNKNFQLFPIPQTEILANPIWFRIQVISANVNRVGKRTFCRDV
jgi:hypothetical protein